MILFSDGQERKMTSRMFKKATGEEVASYLEGIDSLLGNYAGLSDHSQTYNGRETLMDNENDSVTIKDPSRLSTLRVETDYVGQMVKNVDQSFDQHHKKFNKIFDFDNKHSSTAASLSNNTNQQFKFVNNPDKNHGTTLFQQSLITTFLSQPSPNSSSKPTNKKYLKRIKCIKMN